MDRTGDPLEGDQRPLVSVVLPMYNEEKVFATSMAALCDYLLTLEDTYRFEILIVDDGSTDDTLVLARDFASRRPDVRVLTHRTNFELGQALRYTFGQSRGDYVVTFDADLTYAPGHIGELLSTIHATSARIVIASPYMKGGTTHGIPLFRRLLSTSANRFLSFFNQDDLSTITGLVHAYDGPFIRTLDLKALGADVNTEIIQKAQILRARMIEIPAVLDWREVKPHRSDRGFNSRLYWTTAKQLASGFLFRPFLFFLLPGLGLLVVATGFAGWAGLMVLDSHGDGLGWVDSLHASWHDGPAVYFSLAVTLILGVQLVLLGVVTFQNKRYFDELFHLVTMVWREVSDEPELRRRGRIDPPPSG